MEHRSFQLHRILFLLLAVAAGVLVCSYIGINLFHYTAGMDSDIAAEGLTARAMWEHGSIIPSEFYGSTETRIFNVNLIGAGLYGLTGDMNLSMGGACSVMVVALVAAYVVLLRRLGMQGVSIVAAILLVLAAPVTLRHAQILYVQAVYYAIHSVLMLVTLTMWLHVMQERNGWIVRTCVSCVLAFLISLSGLRAALIYCVPLVVLAGLGWIASALFYDREQLRAGSWIRSLVFAVATVAAADAGTLMPTSVSMGTSRNIRNGFSKLIETVIPEMFECIGLGEQDAVRNVLLYVLLAAMLVSIVWTIVKVIRVAGVYRAQGAAGIADERVETDRAWVLAFMVISLGITMVMAAFTTTDSVWRYYYMIWFVLSFGVALLIERLATGERRQILAAGVAVAALLYGVLVWQAELLPALRSDDVRADYDAVISWMEENDYHYGYSTYETANAMTGYCNGAVQISAVADLGQMDICKWLTDETWYGPYVAADTATAYIIPTSKAEEFAPMLEAHDDIVLSLETESYLVYTSETNYTWQ